MPPPDIVLRDAADELREGAKLLPEPLTPSLPLLPPTLEAAPEETLREVLPIPPRLTLPRPIVFCLVVPE